MLPRLSTFISLTALAAAVFVVLSTGPATAGNGLFGQDSFIKQAQQHIAERVASS